jgi:transposase
VYRVALRDDIREWVLVQGRSQRSAAKHFGISRDTVALLLQESPDGERRYRRRKARVAPARERIQPHIEGWLAENERLQRWAPKQRWTAQRMWVELRGMGIAVAASTVRQVVRACRKQRQQTKAKAYVPLAFEPGERAEFDFGHAVVVLDGQRTEVPFLAGRLRYSGAMFLECFPSERQDCFLLGQRHAFEFWGGVTTTVVYDNLKPAVLEILRGHTRIEQEAFTHFRSVYRFEAIFTNTAAGWEKGSVENLVGYGRRTYLVPVPEAASLEDLNARLRAACLRDQERAMAGRAEAIRDRLAGERAALLPLPERPPQIGTLRMVVVRSTGRVRFETNEYSVPTRYAGQRLTLRADPFRVRIYAAEDEVADHPRCYGRGQVVEDFRHYVPLLLEKPFAVPFASALRGAALPPQWESYRRELVARRPDGNREFARVLHLCLTHTVPQVTAALDLAAASDSYSADAVRHLLEWAAVPEPARAPLDPQPYQAYHQRQAHPDLSRYSRLLQAQQEAQG